MQVIKQNDTGAAVLDVQQRLVRAGFLEEEAVTGTFDEATVAALDELCQASGIESRAEVDEAVWAKLVDASFELGDRNLYLRAPFFHGRDVQTLQVALDVLGFSCGGADGIFGAHTEDALRKFQLNMGLPADGIAGAYTFQAILNLQHSWKGKDSFTAEVHLGFARAASVLESNFLCLFGVGEFSRKVAARMSNLALATTSASKVVSADSLLVPPDESTIFVQIMVGNESSAQAVPTVNFIEEATLATRLAQALQASKSKPVRIAVVLPGVTWEGAAESRSSQHYAIVLLDALCSALVVQGTM